MDDGVRCVIDQHTKLYFCSASSLEKTAREQTCRSTKTFATARWFIRLLIVTYTKKNDPSEIIEIQLKIALTTIKLNITLKGIYRSLNMCKPHRFGQLNVVNLKNTSHKSWPHWQRVPFLYEGRDQQCHEWPCLQHPTTVEMLEQQKQKKKHKTSRQIFAAER